MRLTEYGELKIKEFEGLRLKAYECPGKVRTIGYGHTGTVNGRKIASGMTITKEEAERLFISDVEGIEALLGKEPYADLLSEGQWDALVSFIYNLGWGKYRKSTLARKIYNDVNDDSIPGEFRRWVYSDGKVLKGLVKRREWEAQMFEWE